MTSAFAQDGFCNTVSGASRALQTPYSVVQPATATADPTQYSSALATWFVDHLNVPDWGICGKNGSLAVHMADAGTTAVVNVAVPTVLGAVLRTSSSPSSSTVTSARVTDSTRASKGLSAEAKAAIGVCVGVGVLALVVPGLILWYRYRKQRKAMMERKMEEKLETETESS